MIVSAQRLAQNQEYQDRYFDLCGTVYDLSTEYQASRDHAVYLDLCNARQARDIAKREYERDTKAMYR